jgi:hypothetical protein
VVVMMVVRICVVLCCVVFGSVPFNATLPCERLTGATESHWQYQQHCRNPPFTEFS